MSLQTGTVGVQSSHHVGNRDNGVVPGISILRRNLDFGVRRDRGKGALARTTLVVLRRILGTAVQWWERLKLMARCFEQSVDDQYQAVCII